MLPGPILKGPAALEPAMIRTVLTRIIAATISLRRFEEIPLLARYLLNANPSIVAWRSVITASEPLLLPRGSLSGSSLWKVLGSKL